MISGREAKYFVNTYRIQKSKNLNVPFLCTNFFQKKGTIQRKSCILVNVEIGQFVQFHIIIQEAGERLMELCKRTWYGN